MKTKFRSEYLQTLRPNHINNQGRILRKYCLFPNDNAVTSSLINGWIYEPYFFDFIKDNKINLVGSNVIEIGSNNGHFTIELSDLVGDLGKVYAFEPQRIIFQQLCGNIFLNGLDNVYTFQVAIGDKNDWIEFEYPNYHHQGLVNFGDVSVKNNESKVSLAFEKVETRKLDSYNLQNVKLIKIDVQGYEPYVLYGARETINNNRPYIFIEIEGESLKRFNFSEYNLIEIIENLGYVVKRFQEGIPYQTATGVCLDCICIPKEKYELNNYIIK